MKDFLSNNFVAILTLIFVIAKITGHITWSWWLVFSPLIVSAGFAVVVIIITAIIISKE